MPHQPWREDNGISFIPMTAVGFELASYSLHQVIGDPEIMSRTLATEYLPGQRDYESSRSDWTRPTLQNHRVRAKWTEDLQSSNKIQDIPMICRESGYKQRVVLSLWQST